MPEYLNLASTNTTTTSPPPDKTLTIYRESRSNLYTFATADTAPAEYVLATAKPARKSRWAPLLYRGPSATYASSDPIIGSLRRSAFWGKLTLELGDGVAQLEHNREAERVRVSERRKRWWRKRFGMKEREMKEVGEVEVTGLVVGVVMERRPRVGRKMRWEFDGGGYVWSGTRRMARSWFKGVKGYSHDMKIEMLIVLSSKLVRTDDHALIATYDKKHWGRSAGPGINGKGKKRPIGTLRIYPAAYDRPQNMLQGNAAGLDSEMNPIRLLPKHRMGSNMTGTHTGNIFEEAVVMSCWAALEAEHKIRHLILDILIEIAENAGG